MHRMNISRNILRRRQTRNPFDKTKSFQLFSGLPFHMLFQASNLTIEMLPTWGNIGLLENLQQIKLVYQSSGRLFFLRISDRFWNVFWKRGLVRPKWVLSIPWILEHRVQRKITVSSSIRMHGIGWTKILPAAWGENPVSFSKNNSILSQASICLLVCFQSENVSIKPWHLVGLIKLNATHPLGLVDGSKNWPGEIFTLGSYPTTLESPWAALISRNIPKSCGRTIKYGEILQRATRITRVSMERCCSGGRKVRLEFP